MAQGDSHAGESARAAVELVSWTSGTTAGCTWSGTRATPCTSRAAGSANWTIDAER